MNTPTDTDHNTITTAASPMLWLRIEGLALLIASAAVYAALQLNGWIFALLFFTPDLAMLGYLRNPRLGALGYNLIHNYGVSLAVLGLSLLTNWTPGIMLGLILTAHISFDRLFGYGLKYTTAFGDTHLGKVGR
jgi:hypothetical protein